MDKENKNYPVKKRMKFNKRQRKAFAKSMRRKMTIHGCYPLLIEKTAPKCDLCPLFPTCELGEENRKCGIMALMDRVLTKHFFRMPHVQEIDAPIINLLIEQYKFLFWVNAHIYSKKLQDVIAISRLRDAVMSKIMRILSKLGLSPADRLLFNLEQKTDVRELITVLREEDNEEKRTEKDT